MFRNALPLLAAGVLTAFVSQGCVSIVGRRTQAVSVTASPSGARVLVDGEYRGDAPVGLRLDKGLSRVIRIEKDGYRSVEIRLERQKNWLAVILPNLLWALPIAVLGFNPDIQTGSEEFWAVAAPVLGLAVSLGAMVLDGTSAKSTVLRPGHLTVRLEKEGGGTGPVVIPMEEEAFRSITWISVREDDKTPSR